MYQISVVRVLSYRQVCSKVLSFYTKGLGLSLLVYKNGRLLGYICFGLPKLFISNLPRLFCSRSILGFPSFSWYYGLFQAHNYSSWKKSLLEVFFQYTILSTFNPYFTFFFSFFLYLFSMLVILYYFFNTFTFTLMYCIAQRILAFYLYFFKNLVICPCFETI